MEERRDSIKEKSMGMVSIPDVQDFLKFYDEAEKCPELERIHRSFKIKRSTNSVTMLFLGLTNAGISHTMNTLVNQHIVPVGKNTETIIECTFEYPSKSLSCQNSKVHVIDTPGFGDTYNRKRHISYSDINRYFEQQDYLPNMIILVVNITEKKLRGKSGRFISLLKKVKAELGSLIDSAQPNVMIVLTHICSAAEPVQLDPSNLIKSVSDTASSYLGLHSVPVVVAENRAEGHDLRRVKEYYVLPNASLFPHNIYWEMMNMVDAIDPVAESLIQDMFHNYEELAKVEVECREISVVENLVIKSPPITYEWLGIDFSSLLSSEGAKKNLLVQLGEEEQELAEDVQPSIYQVLQGSTEDTAASHNDESSTEIIYDQGAAGDFELFSKPEDFEKIVMENPAKGPEGSANLLDAIDTMAELSSVFFRPCNDSNSVMEFTNSVCQPSICPSSTVSMTSMSMTDGGESLGGSEIATSFDYIALPNEDSSSVMQLTGVDQDSNSCQPQESVILNVGFETPVFGEKKTLVASCAVGEPASISRGEPGETFEDIQDASILAHDGTFEAGEESLKSRISNLDLVRLNSQLSSTGNELDLETPERILATEVQEVASDSIEQVESFESFLALKRLHEIASNKLEHSTPIESTVDLTKPYTSEAFGSSYEVHPGESSTASEPEVTPLPDEKQFNYAHVGSFFDDESQSAPPVIDAPETTAFAFPPVQGPALEPPSSSNKWDDKVEGMMEISQQTTSTESPVPPPPVPPNSLSEISLPPTEQQDLNDSLNMLKNNPLDQLIEESEKEEQEYFLETEIVQLIEKKVSEVGSDTLNESKLLLDGSFSINQDLQSSSASEDQEDGGAPGSVPKNCGSVNNNDSGNVPLELLGKTSLNPVLGEQVGAEEHGNLDLKDDELEIDLLQENNRWEKDRVQFVLYAVLGVGVAGLALVAPKLLALLRS